MFSEDYRPDFIEVFRRKPQAWANVNGSEAYPNLHGYVLFYQTAFGVVVVAEVAGLPQGENCDRPIFAFHIHEGGNCQGNETDAFADVGGHYNPNSCAHPYHAGDLPPLFGANGNAFMSVLTDGFTVRDVIGRSVIIHSHLDDFTTQPSGNAGSKIACGQIRAARGI